MTGIGKKMVKSVRWSALEKGGLHGITFLVFAVLARYISPEDFGLVAMALIIIGFIQLFIDQGFSTAIIQREEIDDEFLSTAFWSNIAISIILGIVLLVLKDAAAWFFNEPRVAELIPWLALALFFEALMGVQQALLKRQFNFRELAIRTTIARLLAGAIAIFGAVSGWGVWSLVSFTVMSGAFSTIILWWVSDWHPNLKFSTHCFKDLLCFGGNVTGVRLMALVNTRVMEVFIGYFFSAAALGYYILASHLVFRICAVIVQVLSQVTMSGFSRVQASPETLMKHLFDVNRLVVVVICPLFAFIGLFADEIVYLLYGDNWEQTANFISLLAPVGPAMYLTSSLGNAIMSSGKPNLALRALMLSTVLLLVVLMVVYPLGIEVMAMTFMISFYALTLPLYFVVAKRVMPLYLRSYMIHLAPFILATAALIATVFLIQFWVRFIDILLLEMVLTIAAASLVYILVLSAMDRKIMVDLWWILRGRAS